jgi:hypothetical protein
MDRSRWDYLARKEDELEEAAQELKRLRTLVEMEDVPESLRTVKYDYLIRGLEFQVIEVRRQLDQLREGQEGRWLDLKENLDLATENLRASLETLDDRIAEG